MLLAEQGRKVRMTQSCLQLVSVCAIAFDGYLQLWSQECPGQHLPRSPTVKSAATGGLPRPTAVSSTSLAAQSVLAEGQSPNIQPLQSLTTLCLNSGTTSAMKSVATILTTQGWEAASRYIGCATGVQQDKSTAGQHSQHPGLATISVVAQSVLAM